MKILHTSDWHLGDKLGARRLERRPHLKNGLNQIARYLEEYKVDVMIISGDVFSDQLLMEARRDAIGDIHEAFQAFVQAGGTIIAISGNHDSEPFFDLLYDATELVSGGKSFRPDADPGGKLYALAFPKVLRLSDRLGREVVQFLVMPFPNKRRYLRGESGIQTIEQQNMRVMEQFSGAFKHLINEEIDKSKACVMVSHLFINGVELPHTRFHLTEAQEMIFSRQELPTSWAYIACGHIHRPQAIFNNAEHIRYAGSIERLDLGESADDKSVTLVEIRDGQRVDQPKLLPLKAAPLYRVEISDLEQIPHLREIYPDADKALVKYFLHWDKSKGYNLAEIRREIERAFPEWYDHEMVNLNPSGQPITTGPRQISNIRETVEMFLESQIPENDLCREKLLERAKILLTQEGY